MAVNNRIDDLGTIGSIAMLLGLFSLCDGHAAWTPSVRRCKHKDPSLPVESLWHPTWWPIPLSRSTRKSTPPTASLVLIHCRENPYPINTGEILGERGPLPKPTGRKILEGNPGKRPLPTDEPIPDAMAEVPPPPDWLTPLGKAAWNYAAEELAAVKMLHRLDLATLELFAVSYDSWRTMVEQVKVVGYVKTFYDDEGNEKYSQPTVEATLMTKFGDQVNRLSKVLGIGPAHRVGLRVIEVHGKEQQEFDNPVLALIQGGGQLPSPQYERPTFDGKATKKATKKKAAKRVSKKKTVKKKATKKKRGT